MQIIQGQLGVKQVLRGIIALGSGVVSQDVTIAAVDMSKTEVRMLGYYGAAGDSYGYLRLTSPTTINFSRNAAASVGSVAYEVTINA